MRPRKNRIEEKNKDHHIRCDFTFGMRTMIYYCVCAKAIRCVPWVGVLTNDWPSMTNKTTNTFNLFSNNICAPQFIALLVTSLTSRVYYTLYCAFASFCIIIDWLCREQRASASLGTSINNDFFIESIHPSNKIFGKKIFRKFLFLGRKFPL